MCRLSLLEFKRMYLNSNYCKGSVVGEDLNLDEEIDILIRMPEQPSVEKLVSVLEKCRRKKDIASAHRVYAVICNNGMEDHRIVGNHIVPMFVECGSLSDAQQVFNRLVCRKEHSWTSLIAGYIQCGCLEHAFSLFQKMQEDNVYPSSFTLVPLLKACARLKEVAKGREIHVEVIHRGFDRDVVVGNSLVSMYAKCGSLSEAHEVLCKLPVQEVVSWTALVAGYAEHGHNQEALKCFEQMQLDSISPNAVTFVLILKVCNSIGAIDTGRKIHTQITRMGFEGYPFVDSSLVSTYAKCGSFSEAWEVFDKLPFQDVLSWNALITGYVEHGQPLEAMKCFEQMQLESVSPNVTTFIYILKVCGNMGAIRKSQEIDMEITQQGFQGVFIATTLVTMYAQCGLLKEAQEVFAKLPVRSVVSWSALISGYANHGPAEEALEFFNQMQQEGVSPDTATFVCVLKCCSNIRAIDKGRKIHINITQTEFERCPSVGNVLVDMYAKCGSLSEAQEAFDKLQVRDIVSWTTVISGYTELGLSQDALKYFEQMQLEGLSPNAVTFVCILKACSRMKDIDKCRQMHLEITLKGLERELFLGSALVSMYVKCGLLSEACEVFVKLPVRDMVSYTAIIAGYSEHGLSQEVLKWFEQMQLDGIPPDSITFVSVLKAWGCIGALDQGQDLYADITQQGLERCAFVGNALIEMYSRCGSLLEFQELFDKLSSQEVVSWNVLIAGCVINHEVDMALQYFDNMCQQGVKPNVFTFTCVLTACSHASLVFEGQGYLNLMREDYGIAATIDHYTCMVDNLARSGQLYDAAKFLEIVPCPVNEGAWRALLSGCKTFGEAELGWKCFQQLVQINAEDASSYVLMADIYAAAGRWDDACRIEQLRKHAGAKKQPASALIEVNKKVQEFVVGDNRSQEISVMLKILSSRMKDDAHVPNLDMVRS